MTLNCDSAPLSREDVAESGSQALAAYDLYQAVFELRQFDDLERLVAPTYRSHTSAEETDRDALKAHFAQMLAGTRHIQVITHFAIEQADQCALLHSFRVELEDGSTMLIRTADCFRFQDGLIVEHWDAVMDATPFFLTAQVAAAGDNEMPAAERREG
ncbi:nuclear transport factor 2 family protein [Nostoc sp. CHAB 5844]|nr:nuclear transport factor 2 family protein [Nostoc sp. CHAB 5844]